MYYDFHEGNVLAGNVQDRTMHECELKRWDASQLSWKRILNITCSLVLLFTTTALKFIIDKSCHVVCSVLFNISYLYFYFFFHFYNYEAS